MFHLFPCLPNVEREEIFMLYFTCLCILVFRIDLIHVRQMLNNVSSRLYDLIYLFETSFYCAAQAVFELRILLTQSPE